MHGKVKWYQEKKGYGYIIGDDDVTYFFEIMNCEGSDDSFCPGDEVLFIPHFREVEYATEVEKLRQQKNFKILTKIGELDKMNKEDGL